MGGVTSIGSQVISFNHGMTVNTARTTGQVEQRFEPPATVEASGMIRSHPTRPGLLAVYSAPDEAGERHVTASYQLGADSVWHLFVDALPLQPELEA